jgi:hypothetical protein
MALMEKMRGHKLIKCSTFEKRKKEKNGTLWIEGKGIRYGVCFAS